MKPSLAEIDAQLGALGTEPPELVRVLRAYGALSLSLEAADEALDELLQHDAQYRQAEVGAQAADPVPYAHVSQPPCAADAASQEAFARGPGSTPPSSAPQAPSAPPETPSRLAKQASEVRYEATVRPRQATAGDTYRELRVFPQGYPESPGERAAKPPPPIDLAEDCTTPPGLHGVRPDLAIRLDRPQTLPPNQRQQPPPLPPPIPSIHRGSTAEVVELLDGAELIELDD